jgi:nucleotide-binding universal stress UspA family protein
MRRVRGLLKAESLCWGSGLFFRRARVETPEADERVIIIVAGLSAPPVLHGLKSGCRLVGVPMKVPQPIGSGRSDFPMAAADEMRASSVELRNILFAMDFSADSFRAFPFAVRIALQYGSKLFVAHVVPDGHPAPMNDQASIDKRLQASVEAALRTRSEYLDEVPHEILVDHGAINARLLATAQACKIDLVVIGVHGWHGLRKLLKGSTSQELACLASKPVLAVGPKVFGQKDLRRVLFVTDLLPSSVEALAYALSFAESYRAELVVLNVNDGEGQVTPSEARPRAEQFFRRYVADRLPKQSNLIVDFGPRTELILEYAARAGSDLIVMGLNHLGGMKARIVSHLPGASSYEVISEAHCPVLTVPLRGQEDRTQ